METTFEVGPNTVMIVVQIVTLLGLALKTWADQRDKQEVKVALANSTAKAVEATGEVKAAIADNTKKAKEATGEMKAALADNTQKTVEGIHAANHVNIKISDLNARLLAEQRLHPRRQGDARWVIGHGYQLTGMRPEMWTHPHSVYGTPNTIAGRYLGAILGGRTWHLFEIKIDKAEAGVILLSDEDANQMTVVPIDQAKIGAAQK